MISTRKPPIKLADLGIPQGARLVFLEDLDGPDDELPQCIVTENNKVIYAGETLSLSAAALKVLHAAGSTAKSVNGARYCVLDGETLAARRLRMEDENGND